MSLARRRLLLASTALALTMHSKDKKPIYSPVEQQPELQVVPPSALEYNIALARTHVEKAYDRTHSWVKDRVGNWITLEERVERRIKSFKSPTEPLTPGVLYVLTSTLFGSVLARSSSLLRFTLPPALLVASSLHFLPETSANIQNYIYDLEKEHTPELARMQTELTRSTSNGLHIIRDSWSTSKRFVEVGVQRSAGWLADVSGLKVHEVFGIARHTSSMAREMAAEGLQTLKEKAEKSLEK